MPYPDSPGAVVVDGGVITSADMNAKRTAILGHQTEMGTSPKGAYANIQARLDASDTGKAPRAGTISIDDYTGTDDARLTLALTAAAAATYPPVITLSNRQYTFATKGRAPFEGLAICGPGGGALQEGAGGATGRHSECLLTFDSSVDGTGWFHATAVGQARNNSYDCLNFKASGSNKPCVITQTIGSTFTYWLLGMTNITSDGMWGVVGQWGATNGSQRVFLTASTFDGKGWNINNGYSEAFYTGGSDNVFFPQGGFLDTNPAARPGPAGAGRYHLHFDYMTKSYVGPIFITGEEKWGACLVEGANYNASETDNSGGPIVFYGTKFEGRNPTQSSFGSVFRQDGGITKFYGCEFRQAMEAPATAARSPQDAGAVHAYGGARMTFYSPSYDRASGQLETVPFIYASGSDTHVRPNDVDHTTRGGTWTGLPRVQLASGATCKTTDGTYTVI